MLKTQIARAKAWWATVLTKDEKNVLYAGVAGIVLLVFVVAIVN